MYHFENTIINKSKPYFERQPLNLSEEKLSTVKKYLVLPILSNTLNDKMSLSLTYLLGCFNIIN